LKLNGFPINIDSADFLLTYNLRRENNSYECLKQENKKETENLQNPRQWW
jgi:hypothetical protein